MISVYYDLHIHSALSPCANDDMTPNDIVGMAILNGLDLIAVTDHNSLLNSEAVIKAAKSARTQTGQELIVLPGAEITTVEEAHVLCLFSNLDAAKSFETEMTPFYSTLSNRIDIFGTQTIYDENDHVIGELERMLIAPTSISFDDLYHLVHKYQGAFIPAHIDRSSFSVISNLGFIPPHLKINTVEISPIGAENGYHLLNPDLVGNRTTIFSSDAHQLWTIKDGIRFLSLPNRTAEDAIDFLR